MAEIFAVGDIVEMVDAPDFPSDWRQHLGKRGVVAWVPDAQEDPEYPNIIVTFEDPAFTGCTTRASHFRKVE